MLVRLCVLLVVFMTIAVAALNMSLAGAYMYIYSRSDILCCRRVGSSSKVTPQIVRSQDSKGSSIDAIPLADTGAPKKVTKKDERVGFLASHRFFWVGSILGDPGILCVWLTGQSSR